MCTRLIRCLLPLLLFLGLATGTSPAMAAPASAAPTDVATPISPTPPMGWSSWSALREGSGLTQDGIKAQARVMHDKLWRYGYRYINIDAGWSDHLDAYGRNAWDTARFPDGIPALATYLHRLGLKFGIYLTPGIPIEAYQKNLPVQGTAYHMQDIADPTQPGNTHNDSYRIDFGKPGAEEYVQSYADLFASWGVDYIKMDFVAPAVASSPPTTAPRCGRGTRRPSPPVVRCTWSFPTRSVSPTPPPGRPPATAGAPAATSSAIAASTDSVPR